MQHTLRAAAKAVGRDRTTLMRAIRSGKLSAMRADAGAWLIDAAELHRVYPPLEHAQADAPGDAQVRTPDKRDIEIAELRVRVEAAQEVARVQAEALADLRRRLDIATGQLGETLAQVRQLTDQRPTRRWWSRLLPGGVG